MASFPKHEYSLRLGSVAPDFTAETTIGTINFHEWLGDSWVRRQRPQSVSSLTIAGHSLFASRRRAFSWQLRSFLTIPPDFTPVCTTELGEVARRADDFAKRNVKVIGISANSLDDHKKWVEDINAYGGKVGPTDVQFPIIADPDRRVSYIYDMLDYQDATNKDLKGLPFTIRTVFVIDPKKIIRLTLSYPAVAGRNFDEIIRVVDAIQLGDKHRIATPVNWKQGEDVIVHASVGKEEAKTLFPNHVEHFPYLRTTSQPV
ncbi:1-cys peroxiredoxin [Mycena chlorophos]|uniref:1-cys peroxiredoxin n=1 Tax=Mycena chlorophos TaxID=658473 RepID=A0A8H6WFQ6_MYCCL|nr:1-cys peroxiredoxin [Mycena chlorophos]